MTILYTNGCSWTVGNELEFDEELFNAYVSAHTPYNMVDYYNQYNWTSYLGKKLNANTIINDSIGAGSNQRMIRKTIDFILNLSSEEQKDLIVVLGWTSAERHEIYVEDKRIRGWQILNLTQPFDQTLIPPDPLLASDLVKKIEKYRKHYLSSGSSLIGSIDLYLYQQFLMKNTLENLDIKYLFFQSVPAWWDTWIDTDVYEMFKLKLKSTDHKNNMGIYIKNAMQTVCNIKGFKHAPNMHVLSDGHKYWAEEVLFPKIMELYYAD